MPELPDAMRDRFIEVYELSFADASQLVSDRSLAEYFETAASIAESESLGKLDPGRIYTRTQQFRQNRG